MSFIVLMNKELTRVWTNEERVPFRYTSIEEAEKASDDDAFTPVREDIARELVVRYEALVAVRTKLEGIVRIFKNDYK